MTLVRLAVNLGFAAGPALGGLIIMNMGWRIILGRWKFLYHIDSDFTVLVKERKKSADLKTAESETEIPVSVFRTRYSGSSSLFVL
jgi:MFS family permease